MAKLIINDVEYDIPDGSKIRTACARAGVLFNCNTGVCGECEIEVIAGMENLNSITEEEHQLGLQPGRRLACMCSIKAGSVTIKTI